MAPGTMRAWGRYSGVNVNLILRIWGDTLPGPRPEESVRSAISPGFRQSRSPFPGKAPGRAPTPILEAAEGITAEVEDPHLVGGETAAPVECTPQETGPAPRTRYGGIPTKPGAPPTAHPPSTPSMMSSRITPDDVQPDHWRADTSPGPSPLLASRGPVSRIPMPADPAGDKI